VTDKREDQEARRASPRQEAGFDAAVDRVRKRNDETRKVAKGRREAFARLRADLKSRAETGR
jgi:hypothetical protein